MIRILGQEYSPNWLISSNPKFSPSLVTPVSEMGQNLGCIPNLGSILQVIDGLMACMCKFSKSRARTIFFRGNRCQCNLDGQRARSLLRPAPKHWVSHHERPKDGEIPGELCIKIVQHKCKVYRASIKAARAACSSACPLAPQL